MNVYKMSSSGNCVRALAAARLGYEPVGDDSPSPVLKEGQRHEAHIAEDLKELGYDLEDAGECLQCKEEFGVTGISGHHVEIPTPLIRLVGHIDRYLLIDGVRFPCEFKSMGFFPYQRFLKEGLAAYPDYQAQIACYIGYTQKPALYVVKSRDSGQMKICTVPYGEYVIPGHQVLPVSITLDQVIDRLHTAEAYVRTGELPECEKPVTQRRWCEFRYLCQAPSEATGITVATEELLEAARLYREGTSLKDQGEEMVARGKETLLTHAKSMGKTAKYQVGDVVVTYRGLRSRTTIDQKKLKELVSDEVLKAVTTQTKPYEDVSIKVLEE